MRKKDIAELRRRRQKATRALVTLHEIRLDVQELSVRQAEELLGIASRLRRWIERRRTI